MEDLKKQLIELENKIQFHEVINPLVSASSVGWHIEHAFLVLNITIDATEKSNPELYKKTFNFKRFMVFMINKIPRGKVRAPKAVQPTVQFDADSLKLHLAQSSVNAEKLYTLNPNKYFDHPFLGHLKLKPTIKFIKLHTQHHINIINEIIASKD